MDAKRLTVPFSWPVACCLVSRDSRYPRVLLWIRMHACTHAQENTDRHGSPQVGTPFLERGLFSSQSAYAEPQPRVETLACRVLAIRIKDQNGSAPKSGSLVHTYLGTLSLTSVSKTRKFPQKKSSSSGFCGSPYLSLNSFLVSHLASGIMVSFMSMIPLFFWSIWEASMTIRFRYSTDNAPDCLLDRCNHLARRGRGDEEGRMYHCLADPSVERACRPQCLSGSS